MALSKTRSLRNDPHTWPGFVDALAALLMVVIFVLMIFSLAQFYLNQIVSGQDEALFDLNKEISDLYRLLQLEKDSTSNLNNQINQLKLDFETTNQNLSEQIKENDALSEVILSLKKTLSDTKDNLNKTEVELSNLRQKNILDYSNFESKISELEETNIQNYSNFESKIAKLVKEISVNRDELAIKIDDILQLEKIKTKLQLEVENLVLKDQEINSELLQERDYSKTLEEKIASLKDKALLSQKENIESSKEIIKLRSQINTLKVALSEVNLKLSQLQALFEKQKAEDEKNKVETVNLGKNLNSALASRVKELQKFRSEFFGRLSELLENREEIRIVGDRFVFQSELLFEKGSADLGNKGDEQLKKLFVTLDDIAKTIPNDINWVLQVEGHTDNIPITAGKFLDNWDLSTERALSVVRFLINQGISPSRLSATGYGEHQPISIIDSDLTQEEINSKNRRIELKITQRIVN